MSWLQSIKDFKYLLFLLVPVGIYLMVISIKKITAFAKAKMIYEMSVSSIDGSFTLEDGGKYDIWLSGKKYAVSPIYNLDIKLKNNATGKSVILYPDFFRTTANSFKDARVKLYTFSVESGSYNISLTDSVEERENIINNRGIDYKKFSIQIRENVQGLTIFLGVLGIILGFMAIDVGLVFPLLYKF
ncbi:hypothetical protein [Lachnoanaerobaculum gingivalis]|uniref:hypothetical protein n=1 Tax=Lachnoanaerobaculum gingivalis TaxID=2490855 RepID=UPI0024A71FA9|nr:hypothetical protein [Lachnoanaerobaculum gingivalis]WHE88731.1 hypothetical protein QJR73_06995 [Lachnoanaerobaculum gingivalis]